MAILPYRHICSAAGATAGSPKMKLEAMAPNPHQFGRYYLTKEKDLSNRTVKGSGPTGILTAELSRNRVISTTNRNCAECEFSDHKADAIYCKKCGSKL